MGHFGAFLGVFGIFEVLVEIWGILRVLVSCKITRGIKLVVGRVTERVLGAWGCFGEFGGSEGGSRVVCLTHIGHFLPLWKSCTVPDLVPNTT